MKTLFTPLITLLLTFSVFADDYNLADLPYYKLSQKELKKAYLDVASAFVESKSALEAVKYIGSTSPQEVGEFTKAYRLFHQKRTGELTGDIHIAVQSDRQFSVHVLKAEGGQKNAVRLVWMADAEGPKVDWRASYISSEMSWESFFENTPRIPTVMRVQLTIGHYYNFKYADDKEWLCCRVLHPFLDRELFAYIKRDEQDFNDAIYNIEKGKTINFILAINFPDEVKGENQVEVTKLINSSWYSNN